MTADETFDTFAKQWAEQNPDFRLDDPQVREDVIVVLSAMMSLLATTTPEVWLAFMEDCAESATARVPLEIQERIKRSIS